MAKTHNGLGITENKDFGELIFSHNIQGCSVILLRYGKSDLKAVENNLLKTLDYYKNIDDCYFFTINGKKIRVRKI